MKDVVLLRPEMLWLAALLLPLLFVGARRLRGLAGWRRGSALLLQSLSALLLLLAMAEPSLVRPDTDLSLVVVLDASASIAHASRQQAVAYAKGVLQSAGPTDRVPFVAAGERASLLTNEEVASGEWRVAGDQGSEGNGTDLAAGLRLAGSLLDDTGRRRVVLVSDGWETQGQAADEGARLQARGVDLQVVGLAALGSPETIVEGLDVPAYARVGDSIESTVRVFSTEATSGTLRVSVDGAALTPRQVSLKAGENQLSMPQKVETEGFHRIEATLDAPGDTSRENNAASGTLVVKPQPRVLVLEDRPGEAAQLAAALSSQQMTVDVKNPSTLPPKVSDLDGYDSVVMNNVAATSMTLDQQRTLQEYVRRNGRGLVVVGGKTSFAKGDYADSLFEEVLPVSSQPAPRPQKGATAMILIIDRSFSMDEYRSQSRDEPSKFAMAKEAARLAVDALRPGDTLGVLTFDTEHMWAVPVQTIEGDSDKARAKQLIEDIPLGGGTSIFPALDAAASAIRSAQAPTKHLILVTDGQEFGAPDYGPLLGQLRSANTTLSTIGIGNDADKDLLTRLAKEGQGRYYFTEQAQNIPKIVFKETDLALKQALVEGRVQPHLLAPSPVLRGFSPQDVPQLNGYDITTAKDDAVVGLVTDAGDPLLAHWNYGLGRVVAFTSQTGPEWATPWLSWGDFARFWGQAVRWTMASPIKKQLQMRGVEFSSQLSVVGGPSSVVGVAHLSVESLNGDNSFANLADLSAAVRGPSGAITITALAQSAPGRYEGDVSVGEGGAYEVRLTRRGEGAETASETAGFSTPPNMEFQHAGTNDRLLKSLDGGRDYLKQPQQALDRSGLQGSSPDLQPLWMYLLAPALVLLLLSVAVRRVDFRTRRARN